MRFLHLRQTTALFLSALIISSGPRAAPDAKVSLQEALRRPYLDLFELTKTTQFRASEIDSMRDSLKDAQEICISRVKKEASQYAKDIEQAQKELKDQKEMTASSRSELHCKIQDLRALQG